MAVLQRKVQRSLQPPPLLCPAENSLDWVMFKVTDIYKERENAFVAIVQYKAHNYIPNAVDQPEYLWCLCPFSLKLELQKLNSTK